MFTVLSTPKPQYFAKITTQEWCLQILSNFQTSKWLSPELQVCMTVLLDA